MQAANHSWKDRPDSYQYIKHHVDCSLCISNNLLGLDRDYGLQWLIIDNPFKSCGPVSGDTLGDQTC